MKRLWIVFAAMLGVLAIFADDAQKVHVYAQTAAGGATNTIATTEIYTLESYTTPTAPTISGYRFCEWKILNDQPLDSRDAWGRALDSVSAIVYEETTLVAEYLPSTQDDDGDGIPDGWEIYYFGSIGADSDADGDEDGYTNYEEFQNGTNPLVGDAPTWGGIIYADGMLLQ